MTATAQTTLFENMGCTPKDLRHIGIYVQPAIDVRDGQVVQTNKIYIGEGDGNYAVDFPTEFVFLSMDSDWVFEPFELAGQTWPGIAILPVTGDFHLQFKNDQHNCVVINDDCKCFFAHRYQILMRNTKTGELICTDPSIKNGERQNGT